MYKARNYIKALMRCRDVNKAKNLALDSYFGEKETFVNTGSWEEKRLQWKELFENNGWKFPD